MSADSKPGIPVLYDLQDAEEYKAYEARLARFRDEVAESMFPDWDAGEPIVRRLDPVAHPPLSSLGATSPVTGRRYDETKVLVPDMRVVELKSARHPLRYQIEAYDCIVTGGTAGSIITGDNWVWRVGANRTDLYRVFVRGTGESRMVMGDEVMIDLYVGDPELRTATTYAYDGEFTYSDERSRPDHWQKLRLRRGHAYERMIQREVAGAAFLGIAANLGIEKEHTQALERVLFNIVDSCG